MNYGRIRRGPMAADAIEKHFTQIHNALFRDRRISFKAKGIFGLISTHRDGYGITPESIANDGKDGIAAVRSALQELERYGYLERTQERRLDGTMGPTTYYITDMPMSEPRIDFQQPALTSGNAEIGRSEPDIDFPHAVEPQAADRTHKKTTSKHTSQKKTSSPRVPKPRAVPDPAPEPEEEGSADSNDTNRARLFLMTLPAPWDLGPADAQRLAPQLATAVTSLGLDYDDQLTAQIAYNPGGINNYAQVIETRRIPNLKPPAASRTPRTPAWCGHCNRGERPVSLMQRTIELPDGRDVKCPRCHPTAMPAAA